MSEPTPAEVLAWLRERPDAKRPYILPADLQMAYRVGWNRACSLLEALVEAGDLERIGSDRMAFRLVPSRACPRNGYSLHLSAKEHGALLVGLEVLGELGEVVHALHAHFADRLTPDRVGALRAIRSRLKRPGS